MIVVTYKQWIDGRWLDGDRYVRGSCHEHTSTYEDKSKLLEYMKKCEEEGHPMIISGIWELS